MNGERIRQVREFLGQTQEQFGSLVGLSQGAIAHLESGRMDATPEVANSIALKTGFSLDFYRSSEPDLPEGSLLFRCNDRKLKAGEKDRARRFAQMAYEVATHLMSRLKDIPVSVPCGASTDPVEAAAIARSALGLSPDAPIPNLIACLERAGVIVVSLPYSVDGLDGFSTWVQGKDGRRPLILLGKQNHGYRIRFTAGEEFGHLTMHTPLLVSAKEADAQARRFSGELLAPKDGLLREIDTPVTLTGLARLKHRRKLSIAALLRRTFDIGLIDNNQYRYLNYQISVRKWKTVEPGDEQILPESPRLLAKMAEVAYGDNRIRHLREALGIPQSVLRSLIGELPSSNRTVVAMTRK